MSGKCASPGFLLRPCSTSAWYRSRPRRSRPDQNQLLALRPLTPARNVRSSNIILVNYFKIWLSCSIENTGRSLPAYFDVEPETLHFLDQHVKRFRCARFERVITFHDRFVNPGTPLHVIGFHRQQFLKGVSGAVCFQRPHFHFAETLSAILGFAAERLLRN